MSLKVKFYGTRGALPVCDPDFLEFGGNTTCILLTADDTDEIAVFDAGSGIWNLGKELLARDDTPNQLTIVFSHFHWDHIQGFPFFGPAYEGDHKITLLAMGKDRGVPDLRAIFEAPMQSEYYPVRLEHMGAEFEFQMPDKVREIRGDTLVTANRHEHPGGAYGYRFEHAGDVLVIVTDIEHGEDIDPNVVELARDANLLIHDGQFTSQELELKRGWGHSSVDQAIEVAERAGVERLAITHHDPEHDDAFLRAVEKKCQDRFPGCVLAREGVEIEL